VSASCSFALVFCPLDARNQETLFAFLRYSLGTFVFCFFSFTLPRDRISLPHFFWCHLLLFTAFIDATINLTHSLPPSRSLFRFLFTQSTTRLPDQSPLFLLSSSLPPLHLRIVNTNTTKRTLPSRWKPRQDSQALRVCPIKKMSTLLNILAAPDTLVFVTFLIVLTTMSPLQPLGTSSPSVVLDT